MQYFNSKKQTMYVYIIFLKFDNIMAPDKALFQPKSIDMFLISPQKHVL